MYKEEKMKLTVSTVFFVLLLSASSILGQNNTLDDVHLFQTFLRDAPISSTPYGEGGVSFSNFDGGSIFDVGLQGGYAINPQIEVGAGLSFINNSPDKGDGHSGISDLTVAGRYLIKPDEYKISAGSYITLPIGSEDVGQSHFNFGGFGAVRYPLNNGMVITGVVGLDFLEMTKFELNQSTLKIEKKSDYETSLLIGPGVIYPVNEQLNVVGELNIWTKNNYTLLSGGADYKLQMGSKVRGVIGIGLDNGAPDFMIMGSFLHFFK